MKGTFRSAFPWRSVVVIVVGLGIGMLLTIGLTQTATAKVVEIVATTDESGAFVFFDPIGIKVEAGTTIRWVLGKSYHSVTAYHPSNGNYELRIPEAAEPFHSGILIHPGATFEVTLTVPGVYDYLCIPHEAAGMVGRIIVDEPIGPGTRPFGYDPGQGWKPLPKAAQTSFPPIEQIMAEGVVRYQVPD